ncbi:MAG: tetratricopeptide repeat protein [Candidatus Schekmanbacteria bacterium]|nr:tetratricopeptide repeat protein [Candidatus Schekmanbacteria bacterium]
MKTFANIYSKICALMLCLPILLIPMKQVSALEVEPIPLEFQVQFDENDPYEIVLTAEKYRREMSVEDIEEKAWRKIYYDKAVQLYEKATSIDPFFSYDYLSYGYLELAAAEVLKDKEYHYQKATKLTTKLDYDNPEANIYTGQLYGLLEDWDKAKKYLDKAQDQGGNSSSMFIWSGYVYSALKNDGQSQLAYKKAEEVNSDPDSAKWARSQAGKTGKPWGSPPLVPAPAPRRQIQPPSVKMCLKINEFKDSTNSLGTTAQVFSRLLTTTLFESKRFNLVNTEDPQLIDAILTGNIVRIDAKNSQFILDIQVFNPAKGSLLLAELAPISYTLQDNLVQVDIKEAIKVAELIQRKLPRGEGRIVHIDGQNLIVNLGSEQGVQSGVTALLIGKGERTVKDPVSGDVLSRDVYLSEIVFERIDEKYSSARLLTPGRVNLRIGDVVRLK